MGNEHLYEQRADQVFEDLMKTFAPEALANIDGGDLARIQRWLRNRFRLLRLVRKDEIGLKLNAYNETAGVGLQSVKVSVVRPPIVSSIGRMEKRLLRTECKDPTVGIGNPLLVDGGLAPIGVTTFSITPGTAEKIRGVTFHKKGQPGGLFVDKIPAGKKPGEDDMPNPLLPGSPLTVCGPQEAVRMLLAMKDLKDPDLIRDVVSRGIYICTNLVPNGLVNGR